MDPVATLGLAPGLTLIADLAARVFIAIFDYSRNVKKAPVKAKQLRGELQNLSTLLDSLKNWLEVNPLSAQPRITFLTTPTNELEKLLRNMEKRVLQERTTAAARLKWPFTDKENQELVAQIQRYKTDLILALNVDQMWPQFFIQTDL
jgi:hypothetical protein